MANEGKVDLFSTDIKTLGELFTETGKLDKTAVEAGGKPSQLLPVDFGTRVAEVRRRLVELFGNSLLEVVKVGKGIVPETGYIPGKITPWVEEGRFQRALHSVSKVVPGEADPALETGALDRVKGGVYYLSRFVDLARESSDGRSVAELLAQFTADPVAGVGLDRIPWVGQEGQPGSGEILRSRFYEKLNGGDSVRFRITAGITYARYRKVLDSIGGGTELGRAFQTLVNEFYKKFEAVTTGEKFTAKEIWMREQWLGVLFKNLSTIPASSWMTDVWMTALGECKTTDDLVGFVKSFAGQE